MNLNLAILLAVSGVTILYSVWMVVFTAGLSRLRKKAGRGYSSPEKPFVTVIIPARNEAVNITRILNEMVSQDYPAGRFEVILSDDDSGDETLTVARQFASLHEGFPLVCLSAPVPGALRGGKKQAIARAVEVACSDLLLFTDADTFRGSGWISAMADFFADPLVMLTAGPVAFTGEKNLLQRVQGLEFLGLMGVTAGSAALGIPVMCNGANLAVRREAFRPAGEQYRSGDDQFLLGDIRKRFGPGSVVFAAHSAAVVTTVPEATLRGFFSQRIRWVSKSPGYRDPAVIFTGLVTWMAHGLLLVFIMAGWVEREWLLPALALWMIKIAADLPLVLTMGRFFGKKTPGWLYILAQLFQLIYVPLTGVLGLILPFTWKGRKG